MSNFFKKKIPGSDELFRRFLSPWYPENDRPETIRPDLYEIAAYEGYPIRLDEAQYLAPELLEETQKLITQTMTNSALQDFRLIIDSPKLDLTVLDAVDKYYNRSKVREIINESNPSDFSNPYLVTVCEFGVMLGHLFNNLEGYGWLYSFPYFNSIIVHKETGLAITVFDWAVQKFSEDGVSDGYVAKFHMALEVIAQKTRQL